jgi:alkanesulfonate monooxygenase SsuD/methylene tetrahydromethanopterin reductase-like flavin-dependent oxidoreductase (luciferase family)
VLCILIRLGLSFFGNLTIDSITDLSVQAEKREFESVWIAEGTGSDAFVAGTAIARQTSKIKIGTDIVSIYTRHPCVIASAYASVDVLSKGRFRLGLGASHSSIVKKQLGLDYSRPVKRMEESIKIIRKLLESEGPVFFNGEVFQVSNYSLWIKPVRARGEIYIAAGGPRMVEVLAREADGSLFFLKTEGSLRKSVKRINEISVEIKRSNVPDIGLVIPCSFHDDPARALNAARVGLAMYITHYEVYQKLLSQQGFAEQVKKVTLANSSDLVRAARCIDDQMVYSLTLVGSSKGDIRKQIELFARCGAKLVILEPCFFPGEEYSETIKRTMEVA